MNPVLIAQSMHLSALWHWETEQTLLGASVGGRGTRAFKYSNLSSWRGDGARMEPKL